MSMEVLVAGAGIGGLASALACVHHLRAAALRVRVLERAPALQEVGAGIQWGPNVTRLLLAWGLGGALRKVAAFPGRLQVRDALGGQLLGALPLAGRAEARYGAPYVTIHRADAQQLLLEALQPHVQASLHLDMPLQGFGQDADRVWVDTGNGRRWEADVLVGADGVWSRVRQQLLADGAARETGHLAFRALLRQQDLPAASRSGDVTAWLGPRLHAVAYPVRAGALLNLVVIVSQPEAVQALRVAGALEGWDHPGHADVLASVLGNCASGLRALAEAVPAWRLWPLCDRPPMQGAHQHGQGRVALVGDAAHPMRPYLAQGAGMAVEDAEVLARCLAGSQWPVPRRLQQFAQQRWQRNARVQARSIRNGQIFHAQGPVRWGRNTAMALAGESLLDLPWLYRGVA